MPKTLYDKSAGTTRLYDYALGVKLAVGAVSAASGAIDAVEVMLCATTDMFVRAGDPAVLDPPVASNAAGSFPLEAGEKFHTQIGQGWKIAATRAGADGFLFIVPVA